MPARVNSDCGFPVCVQQPAAQSETLMVAAGCVSLDPSDSETPFCFSPATVTYNPPIEIMNHFYAGQTAK